jgi:exodeoxyribonuclease-3
MRMVTWNCNMALHKKFYSLCAQKPSIAIVQECADLERLRDKTSAHFPDSAVWVGENPNKGLGVFGFDGYKVELHQSYDASISIIAPIVVSCPKPFHLLAVWAFNRGDNWGRIKPGPFLDALEKYKDFVETAPTIIAGDFNNHIRWDKPGHAGNHRNAVDKAESMGFVSAYHHARNCDQGKETEPTHYWRDRKKDGPTYHIDYIFVPKNWTRNLRKVTVGSFEDWCGSGLSDHVPLTVDLDF